MSKWRGLTAFTFVFCLAGAIATAEIRHHDAVRNAQAQNEMNQSLFPTITTSTEPVDHPPPASAARVPLSAGYSSQSWAVIPGSLTTPAGLKAHDPDALGVVSIRNEKPSQRYVGFDLWIYESGRLVDVLHDDGFIVVKARATTSFPLYQDYNYPPTAYSSKVKSLLGLPDATYVFTVTGTGQG